MTVCRILSAVALAAAMALWGCSSDVALGTSGSETGNARAAGIITGTAGQPVAGATVTFIPISFDPRSGVVDTLPAAVTDNTGSYVVDIVRDLPYNVYAADSTRTQYVLIPALTVARDSVRLAAYQLRESAAASIVLSSDAAAAAGTCFVPGTPFVQDKPAGTRTVTFSEIPAGVLPPTLGAFGTGNPVRISDTIITIENSRATAMAIVVVDSLVILPSELVLARRIVDSLQMRVALVVDDNMQAADAAGVDLVYVTSSADSDALQARLHDVATGVVASESNMYPVMGMVADYTMTGNTAQQNSMVIVDSLHPIAEGLNGTIVVTSNLQNFGWGTPGSGAQVVGVDVANPQRAFIFCYDTGATLASGTPAPGRRCSMFMDRWTVMGLNDVGWGLFDRALLWASGKL